MRFPKVVSVAATLVAVLLLALALLRTTLSDGPEVRLTRLLEDEGPRKLGDKRAANFTEPTSVAVKSWNAEFLIQVPSESQIWLENTAIGVEVLGVRGDWERTAPKGKSPARHLPGRTISRTFWLALPPGVKSCRLTIGFRHETLYERGTRVLKKSAVARRFPAISGWIRKQLPSTERWLECRREIHVTASSLKVKAHNE